MRRAICAVYVEIWEDRLYYRKHNRITHVYYEYDWERCGEAKSILI
jgi:hypothetical protein